MGPSTELLNQMPGGYFSFADEGTLLHINQTLLDQLGYKPTEIVGNSIESLLTIASRIFYQTHFYPLLKLQGKADEIFLSLRMKNGETLPVLLNAATRPQGDSRVYHCVCLAVHQRQKYEDQILQAKRIAEQALRENTELVAAKQALEQHQQLLDQQLVELQQKNQQLSQLGKLITHDIQEPLRKIMLLADALQQAGRQSLVMDNHRLIGQIIKTSQAMRALFRRLRDYLRLEYDRARITWLDLQQVVQKAKERVCQQPETADIRLVTQGLPHIEGDVEQLVALFSELMDNSARFHHPSGLGPVDITITGQLIEHNRFRAIAGKYHYQTFVRITYSDNGPGLEPAVGAKLFQIYKKPSVGLLGLGFGLAICKKIVDNHGGMISVNANQEIGAEFIILLPIHTLADH